MLLSNIVVMWVETPFLPGVLLSNTVVMWGKTLTISPWCVVQLIVTHLKEQNAGLTSQLTELQSQLEWARNTERTLIDSQVLCVCVCVCVVYVVCV